MLFTVLPVGRVAPATSSEKAYLVRDNWNDWWEWRTTLTLVVADSTGRKHSMGSVKIGYFGMAPGVEVVNTVDLPPEFDQLDDRYFSLGQDDNYYESIFALGAPLRDRILSGLRDVVVDADRFERAKDEPVMQNSLLRFVAAAHVTGRFQRLARGDASLTKFKFEYQFPKMAAEDPPLLQFSVIPESTPPTNTHVIIGRNGVGKTRCLQQMTLALLSAQASESPQLGAFRTIDTDTGDQPVESSRVFKNIVSVTFSAFDPFEPLDSNKKDEPLAIPYAYVGLKTGTSVQLSRAKEALLQPGGAVPAEGTRPKGVDELIRDFAASVRICRMGVRAQRWRRALGILEADPLFKEADVATLAGIEDEENLTDSAQATFRRLSSGHKIVLLTITRLVETVEEKTLVLLDEPEAHLHPPLLAAFVRSLSDLLIQRNGVAVIATHSPVVLQEAPKSCVSILRRMGTIVTVERPEIETFGENVGILTREVFGLEVTQSGFHRMLAYEVQTSGIDYEGMVRKFGGQLGAEAKAIVRGLLANRDNHKPT